MPDLARHVKCDESPGACRNCTSSGRSCDGYDFQRLPPPPRGNGRKSAQSRLLLEPKSGIPWVMNTDERRCFSYFQHHTIPALSEFFSSTLWDQLVLQVSHADLAVYHAALALSAIHLDVESYGMPLPGYELHNTLHRFAMEQTGRSYAALNSRRFSQDPRRREVILVCCLLFVLLELLRGQYDDAFRHLESGLRVLDELKAQRQLISWVPQVFPVDECLVAAFAHLDIQAANFKPGGTVLRIENELDRHRALGDPLPAVPNVNEARRAIEPLLGRAFGFLMQCWMLSNADILANYEVLHQQQQRLFSELTCFAQQFDTFYHQSNMSLTPKEQRGADMINILRQTVSLSIQTSLIRDNLLLGWYTPQYEALLSLVKAVMHKFPERPKYTLHLGRKNISDFVSSFRGSLISAFYLGTQLAQVCFRQGLRVTNKE
ncbi:hypothetical protein BBP40_009501 [Aspergillus hancockii]|nr:hypothetical protein BBP40_009501 [Aspergillus hancockii]